MHYVKNYFIIAVLNEWRNLFLLRGEEKDRLDVKGTYYNYEKDINAADFNFIYVCCAGSTEGL